jgi:hypothetical protein
MLDKPESPPLWIIDWGEVTRKNWARKEREKYKKAARTEEYEFFSRRLAWFQGRTLDDLIEREEMERIGKNKNGYKLNLKIYGQTVRIFGFLEKENKVFHPLLFLIKKTNKVTKQDLETFEERMQIYEK